VLLPVCVLAALVFVWQGVPQTLGGFVAAQTLEGATQLIARGPVASQEAIKLLSGDGGGFFNANSAHPFENPTALAGMVQMLLIFLVGIGLTGTFGRMVGDRRQGWALFTVMAALFVIALAAMYAAEAQPNPALAGLGIDQSAGNMEGKEVRFGVAHAALYATVTTASSDGAVEAMFDSFMPLGGLVAMANMMLDEVVVGGPGSGLFGILLFAIVAVFVGGLMIGRPRQRWRARVLRDPVRVYFGGGDQWQRIRRVERQHAVLQSHPGGGDVRGAVPGDRASAVHRRPAGCQAAGAGQRRHAANRRAAVHGIAGRYCRGRRGADVPAGAGARPDRRAFHAVPVTGGRG
jgi:hypothetical protein